MPNKPIIVCVEGGESDRTHNYDREALSYLLEADCGCKVINYNSDYDFAQNALQLRKFFDYGLLILVIVKQQRYFEECHEEVIRIARENISSSLPLIVIPDGWNEERFSNPNQDKFIHIFDYHTDSKLVEFVKKLTAGCKTPINWLGAETEIEQNNLIQQLENAYVKNYLSDDSRMFGTPDANHMIVAEALRIKLLTPDLVKTEFDNTLEVVERNFPIVQDSVYLREQQKIFAMTEKERWEFMAMLLRECGRRLMPNGGMFVECATFGSNVNGFAIDPETFETLMTFRTGDHNQAKYFLLQRILRIEASRRNQMWFRCDKDIEAECHCRLVSGLIFAKLKGFETPIIWLFRDDASEEGFRKAADFIRRDKRFILIDFDGKLIV